MEKFFGDKGDCRGTDPSLIFGKVHSALFQMNREPFVTNAATFTVNEVERRTQNLISFSPSWVDQSIWERVGNVTVDPSGTSAETNFFSLIRYFVGDIACTVLMGRDFTTNNPNILLDLFTLDASFNQLLAGFPRWFPGLAPAYAARGRVHAAVVELQQAMYAVLDDRDPGSKWGDMSDVSQVMQDRAREWRKMNAVPELSATGDMSILWVSLLSSAPQHPPNTALL
jgi:hypothetical protein